VTENTPNLRQLYSDLADGYAERGQPQFRDRFLVLASAVALAEGDAAAAEHYRQRLLAANPHHLLKPYTSFARAMQTPDVQTYVNDLRHNYPADVAKGLLRSLQEFNEPDDRQIPVTAPLIRLDGGPDLLMDDENEPLKIFSLRDDPPSGVPPTLPPNRFPASSPVAQPLQAVPPTMYDVDPPPVLPQPPPPPRPARPAPSQPAPPAVSQPAPPPRVERRPPPAPVSQPARARRVEPQSPPAPIPSPAPPEDEAETGGAWLAALLFGLSATAAAALAFYVLVYPFVGQR
jgi:hypothetical protein